MTDAGPIAFLESHGISTEDATRVVDFAGCESIEDLTLVDEAMAADIIREAGLKPIPAAKLRRAIEAASSAPSPSKEPTVTVPTAPSQTTPPPPPPQNPNYAPEVKEAAAAMATATATIYGPYLRYIGIVKERGASVWTGSAMLVTPLASPAPIMTLSSEEFHRSVEASKKLASTSTHNFHRYAIRLPLRDRPRRYSYGFPDAKPDFSFHLPSADDPYWRCSFTSCNGFTDDVTPEMREKMGGVRPLWDDMLRRHAEDPYYVMLGGGDQIYCDDVWKLPSLREWLAMKGKDVRRNAPWTEQMDEEVDGFYFNHYCHHFASDGIREAYAKIPQVNVCDDHDVFDGFGSYPEYLERSNVFQNLRRIGYKYFLLFQHQTSAEADRGGMFIDGSDSYSVISNLGTRMSVLMLDTRHQRSREHIIRQDEWDATFSALEELPPGTRHLLVVTGVPIVYPRLGDVELSLQITGNVKRTANKGYNVVTKGIGKGVGKVLGDKAQDKFERAANQVKLKMGKSGMMSKVLNDFGEVSLDDDLIDHWTNKHHERERADAIARFQKLSADRNLRITFLAGDVHCGTIGRLFNPKHETDHRLMYQVVSSAVVNAPPPGMVLKKVHASCAKGNAKPTKYGDDGVETHEEMISLFETDVDGESAPGPGKKLIGRRNWCSIQSGGGRDDELEFNLMVENKNWRDQSIPYGVRIPAWEREEIKHRHCSKDTMAQSVEDLEKMYSDQLEQLRIELKQVAEDAKNNAAALHQFLSSEALDDKMAQYVMLYEATPKELAEFASQGPDNLSLIQKLFWNTTLLKEILLADSPKAPQTGPARGAHTWTKAQFGNAMKIYQDILEVSEHATSLEGVLGRLALAIALEHAIPLPQDNPETPPNTGTCPEKTVDPVQRYLNYEMAYLKGELDPAFELLTTWELRMVVDGTEPDETLAWGREMLKNYRPDHVFCDNCIWRYVGMVKSNIRYGSQNVKYDRPDLQFYQNILMNGGVCGRRAFFGRFILRAFGIPTTARPSPGHGALCHWTPNENGWVVNLGGNWGCGTTKTRYQKDLDFLATTQARTNRKAYWKVKRAQWMGDVMEEWRIYGEHDKHAEKCLEFWYRESLKLQKTIIDGLPNKKVPPRRCNKAKHKPTLAERVNVETVSPNARNVQYDSPEKGVITIPAASFSKPRQTKDVLVMKSFLGGFQIYLPDFQPQGLTIMRGGTWKNDANGCCSGVRLLSGGYGYYEDWGFRMAISTPDHGEAHPNEHVMKIDVGGGGDKKVMMEFIYVKPGTFVMGGESEKEGRFQCVEVPKHEVRLTKGFYLGKYPVTQAQYEVVMGSNPSKSTKDPNCPVDNIGVNEALDYCDKLVETIGKDFRLPTEAEWEYACRADQSDKKWFFGDDPSQLGEYAWFKNNAGGKSHPVGLKKPNLFGLYDMYGNVYERVSDKYAKDYYANSPPVDPTGPSQGTKSTFEYKVNLPRAGNYTLEAEVVTANSNQRLNVSINGASEIVMEMPFTNGRWLDSPTVMLALKAGENTIRFWRDSPPQYGITIKKFTITPTN